MRCAGQFFFFINSEDTAFAISYYPPTHHLGVLVQPIGHDNIEKLIMECRKDLLKDIEDFDENKEW